MTAPTATRIQLQKCISAEAGYPDRCDVTPSSAGVRPVPARTLWVIVAGNATSTYAR